MKRNSNIKNIFSYTKVTLNHLIWYKNTLSNIYAFLLRWLLRLICLPSSWNLLLLSPFSCFTSQPFNPVDEEGEQLIPSCRKYNIILQYKNLRRIKYRIHRISKIFRKSEDLSHLVNMSLKKKSIKVKLADFNEEKFHLTKFRVHEKALWD